MSTALRDGVQGLDLTLRLTLAVLSLASGVYTYLGVRDLLDGSAATVAFAAAIYSIAVSVGIYAFWSFMMRFLPHVRDFGSRIVLTLAMLLGSAMIVAMSSWLNAAALAGSAAVEQHLAYTLEDYSADLDRAHNRALAAQSLLPDIEMASVRFARLADAERDDGSLTGTSGSGTVVQLLSQMSNQLTGLAGEVRASGERVAALYTEGSAHIQKMRELVSAGGPVAPRTEAFGTEAMGLIGTIAGLQQTSVAAAVKRAADDLAIGFIAPVADGASADLASRQTAIVGNVERAVAAQSVALANAAEEILSVESPPPTRFQPVSTAEAVLRYAGDFLPSWAGAVSIDLLPAVMVIILCVVHAAIRREGDPVASAGTMTAADLITAARLLRDVDNERLAFAAPVPAAMPVAVPVEAPAPTSRPEAAHAEAAPPLAEPAPEPAGPSAQLVDDAKITPLPSNRLGKKE
ncbi:hypothetical protein [Methylobrevis albus]|uniref:Uncharacterized protein n=1 Tax=Methylobrevis albus TaxID=2793297 RepID=A0A931I1P8_9HYPH|nr:hypothetical protein [Methylobrevis albus]MBH0237680.1 hypothetical protein [Methylobrevis albus]